MTQHAHHERGAVLIVALIFLVILTMLGITAMTGTTMELRMSGNTKDLAIALQAAEAAVRDAENDIQGKTYVGQTARLRTPTPLPTDYGVGGTYATCNNTGSFVGLCRPRSDPQGRAQLLPQDLTNAVSLSGPPSVQYGAYTGAGTLQGVPVSLQPRYIIEQFCMLTKPDGSVGARAGSPCKYYRITAKGFGTNPNSNVVVSEVFTIP